MEVTEEQRKRAESNRLAALAKRKALLESSSHHHHQQQQPPPQNPWKLFKCQKLSPKLASNTTTKTDAAEFSKPRPEPTVLSNPVPPPPPRPPDKFRVRLEVCSPDSFSATPEPLRDFAYPGDDQCLQRLTDCLSNVMPSHYTQNHSGGKACVYKLGDYYSILRCLKSWKSVEVEEIPWGTFNVIERLSHSFIAGRWLPCRPEHLSDEQAIAIASCFMNEGSILVVCPAILRIPWAEELERWLPLCSTSDIHLVTSAYMFLLTPVFGHRDNPAHLKRCPRVVVISYKMLHHLRKSMLDREWAFLIIDESHHVRCSKKASEPEEIKAVLDVAMKIKRIVLLSGTPSLSRPGLLGMNKYEFAKTYCAVRVVRDSQGKFFQIRRLKQHLLVQLPPLRRQIVRLLLKSSDIVSAKAAVAEKKVVNRDTDASEKSVAEDMTSEILVEGDDSGNCCRSVKLSGEEIGVAKLSGFREWLSLHPLLAESDGVEDLDLHPSSQRMIIFAHHHSVLDGIQIKIAIIGLTAGGAGLDLSSARNVVFLELPQNPSWMNQGESRAHRRGQTRAVNVYIFCAKVLICFSVDFLDIFIFYINQCLFTLQDTTDESHWQNLNTSLRRVSSTTDGKYDAIQEILVENISFLETSGKTDRSCEDQILGKAACDTLSAETMKLPDSGSAKDLQPFEASGEVAPKINDRFEELCISDAGSSGKKDDLHNNAHMVSATAITKGPVSKGTSEENDSDTEIGSTGKVSPSKLNEGSEDTWRQEKEFTFHPQTIVDDVRPLQQIEPDESCFDQVGFLRFEVSQYTGRIHLYSCVPGTDLRPRPLFENFRQEELYSLNSQAAENKRGATFKGNPAYRQILLAFVNEWNSLRPIDRRKLVGKPLQLPLAVELGYLSEGINHNNGGLLKGGSKRRNTPLYEISQPLPSNAVWKKVNLCSSYGKKEKEYTQGWTLTDEPLCKLCQEPCMGNNAKTPEFFEDLFCNLGCYEEYRLRTSNQSIRQGLFEIEHGVCTHCQLDCHKLVKHIRPLSLARRQEYIEKVAPNVARRKNLLDKLVNDPNEGNAWHADHIVPVYRGGGECRLENMRTLCVACHSEVTAAQCAERRSTRAKAKKQLKVILSELRNVQSTEGANTNSEGHGHLQKQENILEDELLVNVPGSAYSGEKGTITGNEVLEEYKSQ
ncbi:dna annealing helicase and endonuclease zranb3 [Quercus suber]|uniref:Dna annealing helicase and endonuclease zranb3 n=1 Tax=Quercus suber TaxID=58331 RepID=A0AAW0LM24_QUESU